ncbi:peptidoglycan-binding domain-containing protein [Gracilimonas tropica]|uniref:peptidoglycan-binding domain-containing protein n=1 Tax=Gracilimonas tropica TaxID=454600 RepID=UPI001B7FD3CA|nr:peptidoglycan-binding domain-containing protein [Gracilimonas tropica]
MKLTNPMMSGDDVRQVQNIVGAKVDGVFGPETRTKVIDFQAKMGLTRDGIVGPKTWKAITEYSGEVPVTNKSKVPTLAANSFNDRLLIAGGLALVAGIAATVWRSRK